MCVGWCGLVRILQASECPSDLQAFTFVVSDKCNFITTHLESSKDLYVPTNSDVNLVIFLLKYFMI